MHGAIDARHRLCIMYTIFAHVCVTCVSKDLLIVGSLLVKTFLVNLTVVK